MAKPPISTIRALQKIAEIFISGIYCRWHTPTFILRLERGRKMTRPRRISGGSGWGRTSCDTEGCSVPEERNAEIILHITPEKGVPWGCALTRHHVQCFFKGDAEFLNRYEAVIRAVVARRTPRPLGVRCICGLCDKSTENTRVITNSCHEDKSRNFHVHFDCFMSAKVI